MDKVQMAGSFSSSWPNLSRNLGPQIHLCHLPLHFDNPHASASSAFTFHRCSIHASSTCISASTEDIIKSFLGKSEITIATATHLCWNLKLSLSSAPQHMTISTLTHDPWLPHHMTHQLHVMWPSALKAETVRSCPTSLHPLNPITPLNHHVGCIICTKHEKSILIFSQCAISFYFVPDYACNHSTILWNLGLFYSMPHHHISFFQTLPPHVALLFCFHWLLISGSLTLSVVWSQILATWLT